MGGMKKGHWKRFYRKLHKNDRPKPTPIPTPPTDDRPKATPTPKPTLITLDELKRIALVVFDEQGLKLGDNCNTKLELLLEVLMYLDEESGTSLRNQLDAENLVIEDIPQVGELTLLVLELPEDDSLREKLKPKLNLLIRLKDEKVSLNKKWVKNLIQTFPTLEALQS